MEKQIVLLCLIASLFSSNAGATPPRPYAHAYRDGYTFIAWSDNQTDDQLLARLTRVKQAGARHVSIPFFGCQSSVTSADVGACEVQPREHFLRVARLAKEQGFEVSFLPIVLTPDWRWRGFFDPDDVDGWFKSYTRWILKIALDSKDLGLDEVVAGTEFTRLYRHEAHWKILLQAIRRVYGGPVTLTVNWGDTDHSFWSDVDSIGVSAYYPLSVRRAPTQDDLNTSWAKLHDELMALSRAWDRPLHITEVGYTASDTAPISPWSTDETSRPDDEMQAMCFRAFARAWSGEPGLVRANIWAVGDPDEDELPMSFSTLARPAEAVLAAFFRARESLR